MDLNTRAVVLAGCVLDADEVTMPMHVARNSKLGAIVKSSLNQMPVNNSSSNGVMAFLPAHDDGSRDPDALIAASDSVVSAGNYLRQGRSALTRSVSHFKAVRDDTPEKRDNARLGLAILDSYKSSFATEQEILEIVDTYLEGLSNRENLDLQESNKIRLRLDALEERREALILERRRMTQSIQ